MHNAHQRQNPSSAIFTNERRCNLDCLHDFRVNVLCVLSASELIKPHRLSITYNVAPYDLYGSSFSLFIYIAAGNLVCTVTREVASWNKYRGVLINKYKIFQSAVSCRGRILRLTPLLMMETIRQHLYRLDSLHRRSLKQSHECMNESTWIRHLYTIFTHDVETSCICIHTNCIFIFENSAADS